MRKYYNITKRLIFIMLFTFPFTVQQANAEQILIRFSHVVGEKTPKGMGATMFKTIVEQRIEGNLKLFGTKSPPVIGLDIGSSSVRLLQLSRHGSSYRIDHFAIEPLPQGVIVEKSVQNITNDSPGTPRGNHFQIF